MFRLYITVETQIFLLENDSSGLIVYVGDMSASSLVVCKISENFYVTCIGLDVQWYLSNAFINQSSSICMGYSVLECIQ